MNPFAFRDRPPPPFGPPAVHVNGGFLWNRFCFWVVQFSHDEPPTEYTMKPPDEFAVQLDTALRLNEPLPDPFALVHAEYVPPGQSWNAGYWVVWVLDKRTNVPLAVKVYEQNGRFGPNYAWKWKDTSKDARDRLTAFRMCESFVSELRRAAPYAYLLWPRGLKAEPFNAKRFAEGKQPVGNRVLFPQSWFENFALASLKRPPGTYRVITPPYPRGSTPGVGAVPDQAACVSMVRIGEHPEVPRKHQPDLSPAVVAVFSNVPVGDLEPLPDYAAAFRRLPHRFEESDPTLFAGCCKLAEDRFESFGFDMLAEFVVDRGDVGDWFRRCYWTAVPSTFNTNDVPTQYYADALHAIGLYCNANGRVFMSAEVSARNALQEWDNEWKAN